MTRLTLIGVVVLASVCPARGQDQLEINRNVLRILERLDQRIDRQDAEIAALRREVQELRAQLSARQPSNVAPPAPSHSRIIDGGRRFHFDWLSKQLYEHGQPVSVEPKDGDSAPVDRLKHTIRYYLAALSVRERLNQAEAERYDRRVLSEYIGSIYYYLHQSNAR